MKKKLLFLTLLATLTLSAQKVAFLGAEASVAALADDDAKAAAEWMQTNYGSNFEYIQFSNITTAELSDVDMVVLYYLTSAEGTYSGSSTDVTTLLPSQLQSGTSQTTALTNWVKAGGDMLIAGDPTPFIFTLGRVPSDFMAGDVAGNYKFKEVNNASLETGKDPNDNWGLSLRAGGTTNADQTGHPIFNGLTLETNVEELWLQNSADREVRLIWWNDFNGIISPNCCGDNATNVNFENQLKALKLGSLRHIGDTFGFGAAEFLQTTSGNHADINSGVPTDFNGEIILLSNTLIGYEWDSTNGNAASINANQSNIENFTANIINHLSGITLSVDEGKINNAISVYPNPVEDNLYITNRHQENLYISLYDVNGRLLMKDMEVGNNPIDVSEISTGLFFTKVKDQNGKVLKTLKIIKK